MAKDDLSSPFPDLTGLLSAVDREIAEELRKEQRQLDDPIAVGPLEEIGRHICFHLADQHLAMPLSLVLEVGDLEMVRPLPFLPSWVDGVTNVRGEIVSVVNLADFFGLSGSASQKGRKAVVIHDGAMKTAVIVDKITGTRLLYRKEGMLFRKNETKAGIPSSYLGGPALFLAENAERELELFDGKKLLSSIRLQQ